MSLQSSAVSSIYKSRQIILQQLNQQGYATQDYEYFDINEVFSMMENETLDMLLEKNDVDELSPKIYIHYYLNSKYNQTKIQGLIDELYIAEEKLKQHDILYVIGDSDPNDTMNDLIKDIWEKDKVFVVIQSIKRLQFNVLNHTFQPKFRIMNNAEKNEIKRQYNILDDSKFPEISRHDPVSKAIFIRPGQLCEIIRPSKTAFKSIYYRLCV